MPRRMSIARVRRGPHRAFTPEQAAVKLKSGELPAEPVAWRLALTAVLQSAWQPSGHDRRGLVATPGDARKLRREASGWVVLPVSLAEALPRGLPTSTSTGKRSAGKTIPRARRPPATASPVNDTTVSLTGWISWYSSSFVRASPVLNREDERKKCHAHSLSAA